MYVYVGGWWVEVRRMLLDAYLGRYIMIGTYM